MLYFESRRGRCVARGPEGSAAWRGKPFARNQLAFIKEHHVYEDLQLVEVLSEGELLFKHTMLASARFGKVAPLVAAQRAAWAQGR